ncbi:MAG TPA: PD-(D/E)XK nuclease family protein [Myxococcales bacterium]|nr:PD-(D/E)XK nuclease family protein [Myxococcales bacterium]
MRRAAQLSFDDARRKAPAGPALTVLPDAARVDEYLVRRAAPFVAGRVASTLAQLERDLVREARAAGACPEVASPEALSLLFRDVCREETPREGPFWGIRDQPGFARAAQNLLAALAHGLIEPAELLRLPLPEEARERIAPLSTLLVRARHALDRRGLADPNRALRLSIDALAAGGELPAPLRSAPEITFDAIFDWTPLRVRMVAVLAGRLRVRVRLPWSAQPDLREAVEPALRAFEALGGDQAAPELELFDPAEGGGLSGFLHALFGGAGPARGAPVALRACASPTAQAREVARTCADLIAAGTPPDSIAVAVRSLAGGAAEELAAALDRMGVPWRERRGRPALPAPPLQLALRILGLPERRFPREDVEQVLSSRLLWLPDHGRPLPAQAAVHWLREAHVRDDALDGGYSERLRALAARIQARARSRAAEAKDPAAASATLADAARAAADVEEVLARVQSILRRVQSLPDRATLRDHGTALLELLDRWGMPGRLRRGEHDPGSDETGAFTRAAAAALARDQSALRALEDACSALARAAASLGDEDRTFSRVEWAQLLAAALADASLPSGGARGGAVQLLELRELPGRRFDHVLLAGLVDGELPAPPPIDPLLSDDDRRAVNRAAGRGVFRAPPAEGEAALLPPRQSEEPLLFHLGLCAAQRGAWLFWPRADARGRMALRSPFVDETVRALGLSPEEERRSAAPLSPVPGADACRSRGDLLARVALEALADPAWRVSAPMPREDAWALTAAVAGSPLGARLSRVARAAAAERERLRAFVGEIEPGRFSGKLSGAALQAALPKFRFGPDAPLSAHQLEEHATCGFRTLAHKLLGVEQEEPGEDDLAARERGSLLHRCLDAYFRRLDEEGRLPLCGDPAELETLTEVAAEELEAFAAEEHVGRRALWELRRGELLRTLQDIVVAETRLAGRPIEFERRFGYPDSWEPLRIPDPTGAEIAFVRGAVDRIDRGEGGALLVIDYKSSSRQSLSRKLQPAGLLAPEFQLALYAALLRQREPASEVDAVYVSLRDAERSSTLRDATARAVDFGALLEMDPGRRAELRRSPGPPLNLADAVWARVGRMRQGLFPVQPLSCDFCELKPACRIVALPPDPEENGGTAARAAPVANEAPRG